MLTREDNKNYQSLRKKMSFKDQETQTLPPPPPPTPIQIVFAEQEEDPDWFPKRARSGGSSSDEHTYNDSSEEDYYRSLTKKQRKKIDKTEQDILRVNLKTKPLRFQILESQMDVKLKALAMSKLEKLYMLDPNAGEYFKSLNYIENLIRIPVGVYKNMPVNSSSNITKISEFLDNSRTKLDEKIYGHDDVKEQIIQLLGKWISNKDSKGLAIGLHGPPGCGKTALCKSVAEAIGRPMGFVSLGGMASTDSSILLGHSYTYEGSRWGKIADILMNCQCMNPVFFFDELDKISNTRHGEEIVNVLIHLTDATQNTKFHDRYYCDVELDVSRSLFIFSYNDETLVNPVLKDRLVTIEASGYTIKQKVKIATGHMLPAIYKDFGIDASVFDFSDEILEYIITKVTEEKGVRNFQRGLEHIIGQANLHRLLKKPPLEFPLAVTKDVVDMFLKSKKSSDWPNAHMYM